MKKVYEKPQIYMERFELSQSIASCTVKMNSGDTSQCNGSVYTPDYGDVPVFQESIGCTMPEYYCYEPSANGNIFTS